MKYSVQLPPVPCVWALELLGSNPIQLNQFTVRMDPPTFNPIPFLGLGGYY